LNPVIIRSSLTLINKLLAEFAQLSCALMVKPDLPILSAAAEASVSRLVRPFSASELPGLNVAGGQTSAVTAALAFA
jgi:hypothetical protein